MINGGQLRLPPPPLAPPPSLFHIIFETPWIYTEVEYIVGSYFNFQSSAPFMMVHASAYTKHSRADYALDN